MLDLLLDKIVREPVIPPYSEFLEFEPLDTSTSYYNPIDISKLNFTESGLKNEPKEQSIEEIIKQTGLEAEATVLKDRIENSYIPTGMTSFADVNKYNDLNIPDLIGVDQEELYAQVYPTNTSRKLNLAISIGTHQFAYGLKRLGSQLASLATGNGFDDSNVAAANLADSFLESNIPLYYSENDTEWNKFTGEFAAGAGSVLGSIVEGVVTTAALSIGTALATGGVGAAGGLGSGLARTGVNIKNALKSVKTLRDIRKLQKAVQLTSHNAATASRLGAGTTFSQNLLSTIITTNSEAALQAELNKRDFLDKAIKKLSADGKEITQEQYDKLEKQAEFLQDNTYRANMSLVGFSNYIQLGSILKGKTFLRANQSSKLTTVMENGKIVAKPKSKWWLAKDVAQNSLLEGLEEYWQTGIDKVYQESYLNQLEKSDSSFIEELGRGFSGLADAVTDLDPLFTDPNRRKEFILGAALGGSTNVVLEAAPELAKEKISGTNKKLAADFNERSEALDPEEIISTVAQEHINRLTEQHLYKKGIERQIENNSQRALNDLTVAIALDSYEMGLDEARRDYISQMKKLDYDNFASIVKPETYSTEIQEEVVNDMLTVFDNTIALKKAQETLFPNNPYFKSLNIRQRFANRSPFSAIPGVGGYVDGVLKNTINQTPKEEYKDYSPEVLNNAWRTLKRNQITLAINASILQKSANEIKLELEPEGLLDVLMTNRTLNDNLDDITESFRKDIEFNLPDDITNSTEELNRELETKKKNFLDFKKLTRVEKEKFLIKDLSKEEAILYNAYRKSVEISKDLLEEAERYETEQGLKELMDEAVISQANLEKTRFPEEVEVPELTESEEVTSEEPLPTTTNTNKDTPTVRESVQVNKAGLPEEFENPNPLTNEDVNFNGEDNKTKEEYVKTEEDILKERIIDKHVKEYLNDSNSFDKMGWKDFVEHFKLKNNKVGYFDYVSKEKVLEKNNQKNSKEYNFITKLKTFSTYVENIKTLLINLDKLNKSTESFNNFYKNNKVSDEFKLKRTTYRKTDSGYESVTFGLLRGDEAIIKEITEIRYKELYKSLKTKKEISPLNSIDYFQNSVNYSNNVIKEIEKNYKITSDGNEVPTNQETQTKGLKSEDSLIKEKRLAEQTPSNLGEEDNIINITKSKTEEATKEKIENSINFVLSKLDRATKRENYTKSMTLVGSNVTSTNQDGKLGIELFNIKDKTSLFIPKKGYERFYGTITKKLRDLNYIESTTSKKNTNKNLENFLEQLTLQENRENNISAIRTRLKELGLIEQVKCK